MKTVSTLCCSLLVVALAVPASAGASKKDPVAQARDAVKSVVKAVADEATPKKKRNKRKARKAKAAAKRADGGKGKGAAPGDADDADDGGTPTGKATMPTPKNPADFASFWASFQTIIEAEDLDALAALTEFPFTTRGPMDSDPVEKHTATWLKGHLDVVLDGDGSMDVMDDLVADTTPEAAARSVSGNEARVGSFVFRKTAKGWRFAHAYVLPVASDAPSPPAAAAPGHGQADSVVGVVQNSIYGDESCAVVLKMANGEEDSVQSGFDVCEGANGLIGKKVKITFGPVVLEDCQGDMGCGRTRTETIGAKIGAVP